MDATDRRLLVGLHRKVLHLDKLTAQIAAQEGLTLGQFAVLEALYSKGQQSISAVRERILSSVGTIPVIVRNLERRQLIVRVPSSSDRRVCLIALSEEGRRVIEKIVPENNAMIQAFFAGLTQEEKEQLEHLLQKTGGANRGENH